MNFVACNAINKNGWRAFICRVEESNYTNFIYAIQNKVYYEKNVT